MSLFNEPDSQFRAFDWERPSFGGRSSERAQETEKDREPLAPDYKDPSPAATEDKPVQKGKPLLFFKNKSFFYNYYRYTVTG